tara:strand:- start:9514 stop:9723 length:210 start_codon:yes stop_codon:yes gene_type:complete
MVNEAFIGEAEAQLGMDPTEVAQLKAMVSLDLLLAQAGITDEQVRLAYENRLRTEISEVGNTLLELAQS